VRTHLAGKFPEEGAQLSVCWLEEDRGMCELIICCDETARVNMCCGVHLAEISPDDECGVSLSETCGEVKSPGWTIPEERNAMKNVVQLKQEGVERRNRLLPSIALKQRGGCRSVARRDFPEQVLVPRTALLCKVGALKELVRNSLECGDHDACPVSPGSAKHNIGHRADPFRTGNR
jgi:hypothetical protein